MCVCLCAFIEFHWASDSAPAFFLYMDLSFNVDYKILSDRHLELCLLWYTFPLSIQYARPGYLLSGSKSVLYYLIFPRALKSNIPGRSDSAHLGEMILLGKSLPSMLLH